MGALTSFAKWNPEDDLLLKNAVEAGASLESLAKGAVHFSRRFTLRELEDRWRVLLYDLSTSTEASARIIEIEIGLSISNPCKPSRACNSKAKETLSEKRRGENLRSHYLATLKKLRCEQCISTNLGFSMPPSSHAVIGNGNGSHDLFKLQNELVLNKFPVDGLSHQTHHLVYAKVAEVESSASKNNNVFSGGIVRLVDTKLPDGLSGRDCLYGHAEDEVDEAGYNNSSLNIDRNHYPSQASDVSDSNQTHNLVLNNPGFDGDVELKHSKDFVSTNNNQDNILFGGCDNSTSEFEGCSSFHHLGYSSPPPGRPIWKTIEDVSTPTLQMDGHFVEKGQGALTMNTVKKLDDQGCDGVSRKGKVDHVTSDTTSNNPKIIVNPNFIDFSTSCMRFTDDEELMFIDVDEEDIEDRSCLNGLGSILLNSPVDNRTDNLTIISEPKPSGTSDTAIPACNDESFTEDKTICADIHSGSSIHHSPVAPRVNVVSLSSKSSPEKFAICVLNTEELDVPFNDDVAISIKPFQAFVTADLKQDISPTMPNDAKASTGSSDVVKEEKVVCLQPSIANTRTGHALLQKVGSLHCTVACVAENVISGEGRFENNDEDDKSLILPAIASHSAPILTLKEETAIESDVQPSLSKCVLPHSEQVSLELGGMDQPLSMSVSDHEEQFSDDDVPSFSDVEAMILDMDLGPYDQESCLFTKEVSRYQCMDTKKTIVRLEQGAHSYINRAILSRGAFAIFYGRRLKYFIRSPEVLLGRETEDIKVDIDLGKEGRANKISRRQAIIKMDEDGFFHLKNIGKNSIFVNSKEVPVKKRINLSSCALIEIKDMRFIFEVNDHVVRRHIASLRCRIEGPKSEFDFINT